VTAGEGTGGLPTTPPAALCSTDECIDQAELGCGCGATSSSEMTVTFGGLLLLLFLRRRTVRAARRA
jgi:uncharacterized protein (TIGR03382 family)